MPEKTARKEPGPKPASSPKPNPHQEVAGQLPLPKLHPFPDHPFQVREDASMQETAESVKEYGVLVPTLARPREDGGYERIAAADANTPANWRADYHTGYRPQHRPGRCGHYHGGQQLPARRHSSL